MAQATPMDLSFATLGGKKLEADFDGGTLTSDGGALLLREVDRRIGLVDRLVGALREWRDPRYVVHGLADLVRQRVFQIALGYDDADDVDALRVSNITVEGTSLVRLLSAARFEVVPRGSQVVTAALTPKSAGKVAGRLVLVSNDPTQPRLSIVLTAEIQAPVGKATTGEETRPPTASLQAVYPNPFNMSTVIQYEVSEEGEVRLSIYALSGQVMRRLVWGWQGAGRYTVVWDGRDEEGQVVGAGVYLGRLETGNYQQTHKLMLLK